MPEDLRSDVNERLYYFQQIQNVIGRLAAQGALEGIPNGTRQYLDRIVPVGINSNGRVVMPENFDPEEQVPIFVPKPGENVKGYVIPGAESTELKRVEKYIAKATGTKEITIGANQIPDYPLPPLHPNLGGITTSAVISIHDGPSTVPRTNFAPRLITMNTEAIIKTPILFHYLLGQYIIHEVDHWDFYLHEGPSGQIDTGYTPEQLELVAEKRAYDTQFKVSRNAGDYRDGGRLIDHLIAHYCSMDPEALARRMGQNLRQEIKYRLGNLGMYNMMTAPIIARIATKALGRPDKRFTEEEAEAYRKANLTSYITPVKSNTTPAQKPTTTSSENSVRNTENDTLTPLFEELKTSLGELAARLTNLKDSLEALNAKINYDNFD